MRAARISLLLEAANIFYDAPKLSQLAQLSDRYSSWIRHLTKDILTTKEAGGFETRPYILRVLSALCGQIFLTFARFVVKFAFSSTIFWLRLRRTTIFDITNVSAMGEISDCTNHEQLVKRRPGSKIVRGSRPTCSGFQVGIKSMLHLSFF